uniref:Uncharacterized protein n=1 Tax=Kalanchoe fedtschenkoi TaxID=63787 RepID=A0A7N0RIS8_KALFE
MLDCFNAAKQATDNCHFNHRATCLSGQDIYGGALSEQPSTDLVGWLILIYDWILAFKWLRLTVALFLPFHPYIPRHCYFLESYVMKSYLRSIP